MEPLVIKLVVLYGVFSFILGLLHKFLSGNYEILNWWQVLLLLKFDSVIETRRNSLVTEEAKFMLM